MTMSRPSAYVPGNEFIEIVGARMSVMKTSGQIFDYSLVNYINTSKKRIVKQGGRGYNTLQKYPLLLKQFLHSCSLQCDFVPPLSYTSLGIKTERVICFGQ